MKRLIIFVTFLCLVAGTQAIELNFDKSYRNRQGNKAYKKKDYKSAESKYNDNAVQYPNDARLQYNLGNANYKKNKLDEAITAYQKALSDPRFNERSRALQNMGNAYYQKKQYQEALDAYKKSLVASPNNKESRFNYELTRKAMMQQQKQQNKQQDQKQDQKKQNQQEPKKQPQPQTDQKKKDADQLLKALTENEQNDMKKQAKQQPSQRSRNPKYW